MGAIVERIKATMCFLRCIRRWRSHCHGSWRLGPLTDMYTTPCCRALFHLDPVAKSVWRSCSPTGFSGSLCGLFLCFACCFLFRKEQHFGNLFFPHSMLGRKYWASSCLNRSTQVSWVEIWKPTGERGTCFHSKTL